MASIIKTDVGLTVALFEFHVLARGILRLLPEVAPRRARRSIIMTCIMAAAPML